MVQQIRGIVHIQWNPDLVRKTRCRTGQTGVPSRLCDVVTSDADTLAHRVYFGPEYRTYINRFFNVAVPVLSSLRNLYIFSCRRRRCAPYLFSRFIYLPFTNPGGDSINDKVQKSWEVSGFCKSPVLLSKLHCSDTHKLRTDYRFIISTSDTLVSVCTCLVEG